MTVLGLLLLLADTVPLPKLVLVPGPLSFLFILEQYIQPGLMLLMTIPRIRLPI